MSLPLPNVRIANDANSGTGTPSIGPALRVIQSTKSQSSVVIVAGQLMGILGLTYAGAVTVPMTGDYAPSLRLQQSPKGQATDIMPKLRIY